MRGTLLSTANPFLEVYAIWLQTRSNSNPVNWVGLVVPKEASICYVMSLRNAPQLIEEIQNSISTFEITIISMVCVLKLALKLMHLLIRTWYRLHQMSLRV